MLRLNHKKLEVYKKSLELIKYSYMLTTQIPEHEIYGLISQIRRSCLSVLSNIAEGCSRKSLRERKRYFEISRSSIVELDTQVEIAQSLGYVNVIPVELDEIINQVFAMLSKMEK